MNGDDIADLDAHALSQAIHARQVSCVEVMRAYLSRIHRINPRFNAIVSLAPDDTLLAQAAACEAVAPGVTAEAVDRAAREIIDEAGYGERFFHRTGHGIGMETHEEPYIVNGNSEPLQIGHAFSIEPGIYVNGQWGARIEDIVIVTADGAESVNARSHDLTVVPVS